MGKFTKEYFTTRSNLAGVLLLIDASIPPMEKDLEYADWLIEHSVRSQSSSLSATETNPACPRWRRTKQNSSVGLWKTGIDCLP